MLSRNSKTLLVSTSFNRVVGEADLFFPLFMMSLGVDATLIGAIFSYRIGVATVMNFISGHWCEKHNQKRLYVAGLGLMGAAYILFFFSHHISIALIGIFTLWVGASLAAITWRTIIADSVPIRRQGRIYGLISTSSTLSGSVIILIAGWIAQHSSYHFMYLFFGAGFLILALFAQLTMRDVIHSVTGNGAQYYYLLIDNKRFLLFCIAITVMFAGSWINYPYLPLLYQQAFHATREDVGFLASFVTFSLALVIPIIGHAIDKWSARGTLVLMLGLSSISTSALPFVSSKTLFFLLSIMIALSSYSWVFSNMMMPYLNRIVGSDKKGPYIGIFFVMLGIGSGIGATLGSVLIHYFSLTVLFQVSAAILFVGTLLFLLQKIHEGIVAVGALDREEADQGEGV